MNKSARASLVLFALAAVIAEFGIIFASKYSPAMWLCVSLFAIDVVVFILAVNHTAPSAWYQQFKPAPLSNWQFSAIVVPWVSVTALIAIPVTATLLTPLSMLFGPSLAPVMAGMCAAARAPLNEQTAVQDLISLRNRARNSSEFMQFQRQVLRAADRTDDTRRVAVAVTKRAGCELSKAESYAFLQDSSTAPSYGRALDLAFVAYDRDKQGRHSDANALYWQALKCNANYLPMTRERWQHVIDGLSPQERQAVNRKMVCADTPADFDGILVTRRPIISDWRKDKKGPGRFVDTWDGLGARVYGLPPGLVRAEFPHDLDGFLEPKAQLWYALRERLKAGLRTPFVYHKLSRQPLLQMPDVEHRAGTAPTLADLLPGEWSLIRAEQDAAMTRFWQGYAPKGANWD